MIKALKNVFTLIKRSVRKFKKDDPVRLAGTTAYFTVFALAPIILIIVSVTGFLIGEEKIQEKVFSELNRLLGDQGTQYIRDLVANYHSTEKNIIGAIVGTIVLIITSTTFFMVIQNSLNFIWRVRAKPTSGFVKSIRDRALSFILILILGFILLVFLLIDAAISFFKEYLEELLPNLTVVLIEIGNYIFSVGITTVVFAVIYKFLPDAQIKWKLTWVGALMTALLFTIGKLLIGLAIGKSNVGIMYGAAGSLVLILMWVFYSAIIFYFGAEMTQQYAEMRGHRIIPTDKAVAIEINEVESVE
ncbi:MAG: YihY/virulence factor BrkB family protein [Bacteroidales bacterium]